jgi:hypothetical protein
VSTAVTGKPAIAGRGLRMRYAQARQQIRTLSGAQRWRLDVAEQLADRIIVP